MGTFFELSFALILKYEFRAKSVLNLSKENDFLPML